MRNLITIFLLFFFVSEAQIKDFFKYSTMYTSSSMSTPFSEREDYIAIDKGYENVTQIHPYDYNITLKHGITALKKPLQITLLLVMLMVGSIYLIIRLYVIVAIALLSKISGLDTWELKA